MPNGGGDVKPYKSSVDFMLQTNGLPAINPPWSLITAYDMNDGKILWQLPDGDVTLLAKKGSRAPAATRRAAARWRPAEAWCSSAPRPTARSARATRTRQGAVGIRPARRERRRAGGL